MSWTKGGSRILSRMELLKQIDDSKGTVRPSVLMPEGEDPNSGNWENVAAPSSPPRQEKSVKDDKPEHVQVIGKLFAPYQA